MAPREMYAWRVRGLLCPLCSGFTKGDDLMSEEERWAKVRLIVREECERIEERLMTVLQKPGKAKIGFKNGFFTGLGDIEMAALEATYPAVNVKDEIRSAATWIVMNPNDAPRSNYGGFLNTWLRKHQNQHSLRSVPQLKLEPPKKKACAYCPADATGSIGSILCCSAHVQDAMDQKPRRMLGVVPRPVAGND
jgi:hypothetical protein